VSAPRYRRGLLDLQDRTVLDQLPDGPSSKALDLLTETIRYEPRRGEAAVLARVERTAAEVCGELFRDADEALEEFYASVRVPVMERVGGVEMPKTRADGSFVWEADEWGRPREDWSKLDGMDVERAIARLQRVVAWASDRVAQLWVRAHFAQEVAEDEHADAWHSTRLGTREDKQATARRESRDARWHYLVTLWTWKRAAERLRVLEQTMRDLGFQRSRFIKSQDQGGFSQRTVR
jgi:hypothetical protein